MRADAGNVLLPQEDWVTRREVIRVGAGGVGAVVTARVLGSWFPDSGFGLSPAVDPSPSPVAYTPAAAIRVLDTRTGAGRGGVIGKVGAGATIIVDVSSRVPVDAAAVVVALTATNPTALTFVVAYPSGTARPSTANLIAAADQTITDLAIVPLGAGRTLTVYNSSGSLDLIADLTGWFSPTATSKFNPISPVRILDTRSGVGLTTGPAQLTAEATIDVDLTGHVSDDASAAVINLTAVDPTDLTYLTGYATGTTRPVAATLVAGAHQTISGLGVVPIGPGRRVSIYNRAGSVDVVGDLAAYFSPSTTALFRPITPTRVLDTRLGVGQGGTPAKLSYNTQITVDLSAAVPPGPTGVAFVLTAVNPTQASYVSAFPFSGASPTFANLVFTAGQTISNPVLVGIGPGNRIGLYNRAGSVDLVADVAGYFA